MLLSNEVSISRKVKEIILATRIEEVMSKDRILELYLNEIYLGAGAYGIAEAALTYFDKSLDQLTLGEAAFLAGLPKAPNNYNPVRFPQAAKARRDWVLDRMAEDGYATQAEVAAAKAEPLVLRHREEAEIATGPYFSEEVRRELLARYGEKALYESGLSVRTSLDERLQAASDKALRDGLIAYDRGHGGWRGAVGHIALGPGWPTRLDAAPLPAGAATVGWQLAVVLHTEKRRRSDRPQGRQERAYPVRRDALGAAAAQQRHARPLSAPRRRCREARRSRSGRAAAAAAPPGKGRAAKPATVPLYNLCQIPKVSGALVSIDPHTGRVLAMTGGFSFELSQFNRATQAERQPGSAIKPFVYLTALEHGYTPSTLVDDAPISLSQGPGLPPWSPTNYEHNFIGADSAAGGARTFAQRGNRPCRR